MIPSLLEFRSRVLITYCIEICFAIDAHAGVWGKQRKMVDGNNGKKRRGLYNNAHDGVFRAGLFFFFFFRPSILGGVSESVDSRAGDGLRWC